MQTETHNRRRDRMLWLAVGLAAGLAVAYVWPHEPALANATDRSDNYALTTAQAALIDPIEGIFTLDFLTGDLKGAVLNRQVGKFTAFYYRNVTQDFGLDASAQPRYTIMTGAAQLTNRGGVTFAPAVIYVAELTSGKVACYAFPWRETSSRTPVIPLVPVDSFQFRQPVEAE